MGNARNLGSLLNTSSTIQADDLNIGQLGNRNLIINGAMQVAQRSAGPVSGLDNYYTVDRLRVEAGSTGTTVETSQSTDAPVGFKNSFLYQIKSPNSTVLNSSAVVYRMEGQDMAHLEWGTSNAKTITLSFYVKCSKVVSSLGGSITNNDFNMTYPFDYAITAANTWEYKTITIEGPTSGTWLDGNNVGFRLHFNLGSQSSRLATVGTWANTIARGPTGAGNITQTDEATWQITGVQLEVGDTATPFEHRSYEQELARCQRYFCTIPFDYNLWVYMAYHNMFHAHFTFPQTMRGTPTASWPSGNHRCAMVGFNGVSASVTPADNDGFGFNTNTTRGIMMAIERRASGSTPSDGNVYISEGSSGVIHCNAEL